MIKIDRKKVKADMTKKLGYAQKVGTKWLDSARAHVQEGVSQVKKTKVGKKINAHGKGLMKSKAAKTVTAFAKRHPIGTAVAAGIAIGRITKKRKNGNS